MAVADRIGVMDAGQILQVDTPVNVYSRPASATVASFLGSMNWIDGHASGPGCLMSSIGKLARATAEQSEDGPVRIGIRPESLALSATSNGGANVLPATVRERSFLGDHVLYRLEVESTPMIAKSQDVAGSLPVGTTAYVTIPPESMLVYASGSGE
jgi:ABC-type Fe3+/spermidine/putrescine transport system ATPase subunit